CQQEIYQDAWQVLAAGKAVHGSTLPHGASGAWAAASVQFAPNSVFRLAGFCPAAVFFGEALVCPVVKSDSCHSVARRMLIIYISFWNKGSVQGELRYGSRST